MVGFSPICADEKTDLKILSGGTSRLPGEDGTTKQDWRLFTHKVIELNKKQKKNLKTLPNV